MRLAFSVVSVHLKSTLLWDNLIQMDSKQRFLKSIPKRNSEKGIDRDSKVFREEIDGKLRYPKKGSTRFLGSFVQRFQKGLIDAFGS